MLKPKNLLSTTYSLQPKIILGIDPGLADTGFGIIEKLGSKLKMIDYGSIKTKAGEKSEQRLKEISESLNRLIKKYRPETMAVEKLFFCKNVKTAIAVGQARGVVILAAGQNQLKVVEFTPLQIKLALTSYGKASKKQVQQMVKIVLSLKQIPKPDDAADALAAAICCAHSI
ncbi:MAG: crossover junction endodeoxyribonuclease RuvC [Patescibacteria group bacterium]|jgi:crossover junction endodeoxyribonuclease RuvC